MIQKLNLEGQTLQVVDKGYYSNSGKSRIIAIRVEDPIFSSSLLIPLAVKPEAKTEDIETALKSLRTLYYVEYQGQKGKALRGFVSEIQAENFLELVNGEVLEVETAR
jgi:hypothetical protein